jgi:hypothetical protein
MRYGTEISTVAHRTHNTTRKIREKFRPFERLGCLFVLIFLKHLLTSKYVVRICRNDFEMRMLVDKELSATVMPTIRMTRATHREANTLRKKRLISAFFFFFFRNNNFAFKPIDNRRICKVDFFWTNRTKT